LVHFVYSNCQFIQKPVWVSAPPPRHGSRGYGRFSHRKVPTLRGNLSSPSSSWKVPRKRWYLSIHPDRATSHKTILYNFTAVRTPNLTGFNLLERKKLPSVVNIRNCIQLGSRLVFGTIEFNTNINYSMNHFILIFNIRITGIKLLCTNDGQNRLTVKKNY
jgi:hypothetical protein